MTVTATALRNRTVGDIVAELPDAIGLFSRRKIDFCCHGDVPLGLAAQRQGVDIGELEAALGDLAAMPPGAAPDSAGLVDHILTRFHETHRRELPGLVELARKVEAVHREHPQAPHGLADLFARAGAELEEHMAKEERVLFPAMQAGYRGSLDMPIHVMRHEHESHAEFVHAIEALTYDFAPPADACRSWRALYAGAEKFVADLREHIHLENNVLFPRFERRWS